MKKILVIVMAISMILALSSCGEKKESTDFKNSEDVLKAVYESFSEEQSFPAIGGSSDNMNENGPASFTVGDGVELNSVTGFPVDFASEVKDAASMQHMMNANTLTAAVYSFDGDVNKLADQFSEEISNRQWMCGFPEIFILIKADGFVISAFGDSEIVNEFADKCEEVIGNTEVIVNEPVSE